MLMADGRWPWRSDDDIIIKGCLKQTIRMTASSFDGEARNRRGSITTAGTFAQLSNERRINDFVGEIGRL